MRSIVSDIAHLSGSERRSNRIFRLKSETPQQRNERSKLFLGCANFFPHLSLHIPIVKEMSVSLGLEWD